MPPATALASPFKRLHAALMPDYNAKATAFWWSVVAMGALCLGWALVELRGSSLEVIAQVLAGAALAVVAGFFPVRIPGAKSTFVAGEVFIFLLLLLHGIPAAVLAAAGEAFIGCYRSSKRWTSRIASPAMAALAMSVAAGTMQFALDLVQGRLAENAGVLLLACAGAALLYFTLNTLMVSLVFTLKRNERFDFDAYLSSFLSIGIAYCGSAMVASLLYLTVKSAGLSVLLGALPVIALLLATIHYFMRQQAAEAAVRKNLADAAEREKTQLATHMAALADSERRFHSAFNHASIGMALVDLDGRVLQANAALASLLGRSQAELLTDHRFGDFVHADDADRLARQLAQVHRREAETFAIELRLRHHDGAALWCAVNCGFFNEADSDAPCLILQIQDISARRHAEAQLEHIAFHDGLTGMPNRGRFNTLLEEALAALRVDAQRHFAVMFFDFDRFKLINDSMGHSAGDEFLIQVSRRIQDHVRPGDVVARLGGDEFAVLVHRVDAPETAVALAERLQEVLKQPLQLAGVAVATSASIGITFSRLGYTRPEDMLRDADIAMYRAKAAGKARYALFDAALHTQVSKRLTLEADLRAALAAGTLSVAYQPLYGLADGSLRGFEALARWDHPIFGAVTPDTFIPIAEETGLIIELTDLVMRRACAQVRRWQLRSPALAALKLQVNLSSNDVAHAQLPERVATALRDAGMDARALTLELTENILMQRVESAMESMNRLRQMGVSLAIDDFGTGYSSLSSLSRLPIDSLKIDRSFVAAMASGSKDAEIVRAIVSLGTTLGKSVVAEGIETSSQFSHLRELGCTDGQGYHLSRPLAPEAVDALLDALIEDQQPAYAEDRFVTSASMQFVRH